MGVSPMNLTVSRQMIVSAMAAILVLFVGWGIAFERGTPEIFRRSGALVAAIAALLVILQINEELKSEERKENRGQVSPKLDSNQVDDGIGLKAIEHRVRQRLAINRVRALHRQRIGTATVAASCAAIGELI